MRLSSLSSERTTKSFTEIGHNISSKSTMYTSMVAGLYESIYKNSSKHGTI